MDLQTIKNMVSSEEYNFLRNNDHLGTESSLSDLEEVMHMEQITRHLTLM